MVESLRCRIYGRRFAPQNEEVMAMTITLLELLAVLALLVEVISLCYTVFSKDK